MTSYFVVHFMFEINFKFSLISSNTLLAAGGALGAVPSQQACIFRIYIYYLYVFLTNSFLRFMSAPTAKSLSLPWLAVSHS